MISLFMIHLLFPSVDVTMITAVIHTCDPDVHTFNRGCSPEHIAVRLGHILAGGAFGCYSFLYLSG